MDSANARRPLSADGTLVNDDMTVEESNRLESIKQGWDTLHKTGDRTTRVGLGILPHG